MQYASRKFPQITILFLDCEDYYDRSRRIALGKSREQHDMKDEFDAKGYAIYLLTEGSITEKRELLSNLKSRLILKDKMITLRPEGN